MKHFSAQYVYTNYGPPLLRPIIATDDDGTIISVTDTGGNLTESAGLSFFNGIITPGLINCHCHIELSHFKGLVEPSTGLPEFIGSIRKLRASAAGEPKASAATHDAIMAAEGVVACADICNTTDSFAVKKNSSIYYINLIEVFGINPEGAHRRFREALEVAEAAEAMSLTYNIVPHSAYAISLPLLTMIKEYGVGTPVTSIHFMESDAEKTLLSGNGGPLLESYREFGVDLSTLSLPASHAEAIGKHVTPEGNLILVHNTFADRATVETVNRRGNTYWCLCPGSNMFITGTLPPVMMLRETKSKLVIGTDSLASNNRLSIIAEMLILQESFPGLPLEELIGWATINGAKALGISDYAGSIEVGKKPGLILIENCDLSGLRLTGKSKAKRLI
jgi:cytosine/adenosine deaminase-related metal-dependent hydrolase